MIRESQIKREAQIEKAALQLLIDRGYSSASMLLIAKAANASNETLYRWYSSKTNLFIAVMDKHFAGFAELDTDEKIIRFLARPSTVALTRAAVEDSTLGTRLATILSTHNAPIAIDAVLGRFVFAHLLGAGAQSTTNMQVAQ